MPICVGRKVYSHFAPTNTPPVKNTLPSAFPPHQKPRTPPCHRPITKPAQTKPLNQYKPPPAEQEDANPNASYSSIHRPRHQSANHIPHTHSTSKKDSIFYTLYAEGVGIIKRIGGLVHWRKGSAG
ncbi:hypothetical protein BU26DRAFT_320170 [Trematosphaeria pertusa]|uniref:Uncharacterized protein n=1 Tax=Trematosphaeria pertusa TaxID=390896 RepID=A0A6A6IHQ6_9PLEO|nr:uncharacterized protein BU26DRAFT_320170 [Trematosphaeria pertusa]KAF2249568.1 hypothetical protein BU26DRAFT_320170 [Trematosphaeria pertusa]